MTRTKPLSIIPLTKFAFLAALLLMLFSQPLEAVDLLTEESLIKRVQAHLLVKDFSCACTEARSALQQYPTSQPLWEAYIKALAKAGNEKEMLLAWNKYAVTFDSAYKNRDLIEAIAWSVISSGADSTSPIIRLNALLGAFFSHDNKGVDILYRHLSDCNSILRSAAVQLSSQLRDAKLCEAILKLFREEKAWPVRLQVIKAIGQMQLKAAKPELTAIVANDKSSAEEKVAAIEALVALLDTADREEVGRLAASNRAGLRLMASRIVTHFFQVDNFDYIFPLLQDPCAQVRMAALQTLGILRLTHYQGQQSSEIAAEKLNDPDPAVAIAAAWVLTLNDPVRGHQAFRSWLTHKIPSIRIQASAALCSCGKFGFPLALEIFQESSDPYVRMNLALALIRQRVTVEDACEALCQGLMHNKDRWMWNDYGNFRALAPSNQKQESMTSHPETQNQLVRLDILNEVAMMNYDKAQEAIKDFLQQKSWGLTGLTAALLLTEGNEAALGLVQTLLTDSSQHVKVQAALTLAMWGREETAIATLQQAYAGSERELKEKIIEGIGHVGIQSSIPFLMDKLQEPSPTLKILAAGALLQCLYH